jgi:adenylate cyclase
MTAGPAHDPVRRGRALGMDSSDTAPATLSRSQVIRREEARSERFVAYYRIALGLVGGAILLVARRQIPPFSFAFGEATALLASLYSALLLAVIASSRYARFVKYVSVAFDVLIVTVLLWSFGGDRTFKSPALVLYFVVIGLAAYRFSIRLSVVAGLFSSAAYAALLGLSAHLSTVHFGSVQDEFTGTAISLTNAFIRIVFLLGFTGVCAAIALGYERINRVSALNEVQAEQQRQEKQRVRDTLTRYMTAEVAEVVLKKGNSLDGQSRHVAVLFCDIRGFTRISESLSPSEVVLLLNDILGRLVDAVFQFGGTLDKYLGDGLMAVFGAPLSSGRDEEMAVRAAVRMRDVIEEFNKQRRTGGLAEIQTGIGIHCGVVIAGSIGSLKRLEYTVIGSTVNLASRIEQLNKQFSTDILISEATYRRVRHLVEVEPKPAAEIRGLIDAVTTYRLLWVTPLTDQKVGEEFVRMGAMTGDQVKEVLERQGTEHRFFGEIAVELGYVSDEALGMYLAAARKQGPQ